MLNLCDRENYYEQNVNLSKNHTQKSKNSGCIVESVFAVAVTASYISLPIKIGTLSSQAWWIVPRFGKHEQIHDACQGEIPPETPK